MLRLDQELARGTPKAEALRAAKLALLRGEASPAEETRVREGWSHPRWGAAFLLKGDPR